MLLVKRSVTPLIVTAATTLVATTPLLESILLLRCLGEQPKHVDSGTDQIRAEGVGSTPDEWLKDAYRNAVRKAVGAVVDERTLIENDQVISDQVLTFSDGFVKTYEEVPGSRTIQDGQHRIVIVATVERRSMIAKLKAASVKVKDIDGKGLVAEAITKLETEQTAALLLARHFEDFPQGCFELKVVQEPRLLDKNTESATVEVIVRADVNQSAFRAFATKLARILDNVAKSKGGFQVNLARADAGSGTLVPVAGRTRQWGYVFDRQIPAKVLAECREGDAAVLYLCSNRSKAGDHVEYRCYLFDKSLVPVISSALNRK